MTMSIHLRKVNEKQYRLLKSAVAKKRCHLEQCITIADRKLLGAEDCLENARALASPYETALVTRISKKLMHAKIFGSSM